MEYTIYTITMTIHNTAKKKKIYISYHINEHRVNAF